MSIGLGKKVSTSNLRNLIDVMKKKYEKQKPRYAIIINETSSEEVSSEEEPEFKIRTEEFNANLLPRVLKNDFISSDQTSDLDDVEI